VGGAFAVLRSAVEEERSSRRLAVHSTAEITGANRAEKLLLDLETGVRGYVITRDERFLEPWRAARIEFPRQAAAFADLADDPEERTRARQIERSGKAYIEDYSVPLVAAAHRGDPSAHSLARTLEGKRRVDALRSAFENYGRREQTLLARREHAVEASTNRAIVATTVGIVASVILLLLFGAYLAHAIVLPIRRASGMASRVAAGDLNARVPEGGIAEIGALERGLNTMGRSLETSREELRLLADEQGALRRVATLVARDVPPEEVWDAAALELRQLLGADGAWLLRAEGDGSVTAVANRGAEGLAVGERSALPDDSAARQVLATGRSSQTDRPEGMVVAAPIVVEGRRWGLLAAVWKSTTPPADAEERIAQFSELVATAIAGAAGRAELIASRARVVATADEARRRIQRDLHDGAQQRLVHTVISLKLARRELGDSTGPGPGLVDEALSHAESATAGLRDLVHGILPAALSHGGLRPAIEALAADAPGPVSVDVTAQRLPPALEATAYFIVAEALTNVAKHANATRAEVTVRVDRDILELEVRDDGVGGAQVGGSYGLLGLKDRAAAAGGELRVNSSPGRGTSIVARLPLVSGEPAEVGDVSSR
jgi:signal transduction histidine kinase